MTNARGRNNSLTAFMVQYKSLLEERKKALGRILLTSTQMRSMLQQDASADIDTLLARRSSECHLFANLPIDSAIPDSTLISAAQEAQKLGDSKLAELVHQAISLRARLQDMSDKVLECQADCERLLKARIDETGRALRESGRRRRLDAAYGPACRHDIPSYMDRQT